ncbi:hypothetical protein [Piscinibacterium candidicorallinum]|uniref:AP2 domain-containing protein n=1 Tax=Piscinibacterium candidicorallinum TaxID=1793872 RepID=A0ABV7H1X8_9BURK
MTAHRENLRYESVEPAILKVTTLTTGTVAFLVHFERKNRGYIKRFSNLQYGTERKALAAARKWRDDQRAALPSYTRKEQAVKPLANNTSGVRGVCRIEDRRVSASGEPLILAYWSAYVRDETGRPRAKRFAIHRYGEQRAFDLAVAARKAYVATLSKADRSQGTLQASGRGRIGSRPAART